MKKSVHSVKNPDKTAVSRKKEAVIVAHNVAKEFKSYESEGGISNIFKRKKKIVKALNKVSFTINRGEIVALLGRNGSGKSTMIKILIGVLHPNSGSVSVLGVNPFSERIKLADRLGVVFGSTHPQLYWDLPPIDTFRYIRDIYGVKEEDFESRLNYLVKLLSVKDVYKKQTRQLSLGERMKCEFIAAVLHNPELILMDEPTVGVDLPSRIAIAEAMLTMRERYNTTFVITTHVVDDIANVDRVILLDHGRLFFDGSQKKLHDLFKSKLILELFMAPKSDPLAYANFGKVLKIRNDYLKMQLSRNCVKEKWFIDMISSKNVIDYRISELGLSTMLTEMYKKMDKKGRA